MTRSVLTTLGWSHKPIAIWWRRQRVRMNMMRGDINDLAPQRISSPVWKCYDVSRNNEKIAICHVCFAWWWIIRFSDIRADLLITARLFIPATTRHVSKAALHAAWLKIVFCELALCGGWNKTSSEPLGVTVT